MICIANKFTRRLLIAFSLEVTPIFNISCVTLYELECITGTLFNRSLFPGHYFSLLGLSLAVPVIWEWLGMAWVPHRPRHWSETREQYWWRGPPSSAIVTIITPATSTHNHRQAMTPLNTPDTFNLNFKKFSLYCLLNSLTDYKIVIYNRTAIKIWLELKEKESAWHETESIKKKSLQCQVVKSVFIIDSSLDRDNLDRTSEVNEQGLICICAQSLHRTGCWRLCWRAKFGRWLSDSCSDSFLPLTLPHTARTYSNTSNPRLRNR